MQPLDKWNGICIFAVRNNRNNEKLEALRRSDLNGWIVVDFATPQLAQKIYEANY